MPYPKNKIKFVISGRKRDGTFSKLFDIKIDPADYFIRKEKPLNVAASALKKGGDPHISVDIAFIAEGYQEG